MSHRPAWLRHPLFLLLVVVCASSGAAQGRPATRTAPPPRTPTPAPTTDGLLWCEYASAEYSNGGLMVSCVPPGGPPQQFTVTRDDSPNILEVLAFVNPFDLTRKTIQMLPSLGNTSAISLFPTGLLMGIENGKIRRLRYQHRPS